MLHTTFNFCVEGISTPYTGHAWGGLEHNNGPCLLDGSVDSGWWWFAIGAFQLHNGGAPGPVSPDGQEFLVKIVELYVDFEGKVCSIPHQPTRA